MSFGCKACPRTCTNHNCVAYTFLIILCFLYFSQRKNSKVKKIKCQLCRASYHSRFCSALHQHVHQHNSKVSTGFQCYSCNKRFTKVIRFECHLKCHGFTSTVKSTFQTSKKGDGKSHCLYNCNHWLSSINFFQVVQNLLLC